MNDQQIKAEEHGLVELSKRLQKTTLITVTNVEVQGEEWTPGVEIELEERAINVLAKISFLLDEYHMEVVHVAGEDPEIVKMKSQSTVSKGSI